MEPPSLTSSVLGCLFWPVTLLIIVVCAPLNIFLGKRDWNDAFRR